MPAHRKPLVRQWLSAAFFLLSALALTAQVARVPRAVGNYLIDSWETDDGLPENSATSIAQTPDGYLWFGTFNGLVRSDGVTFAVFDPSNTPELPSLSIINLHTDRQGQLWVSTSRGLLCMKDGQWKRYQAAEGWTGNYVAQFAETRRGELFVMSADGKLSRLANGRFESIPVPVPGPGYRLVMDEREVLYLGRYGSLWRATNSQWESVAEIAGPRGGFNLAPARDGGIWISTVDGLNRMRDGRIEPKQNSPFNIREIWSLKEDSDGNVWIATSGDGVFVRHADGHWEHFTEGAGLSYKAARAVFEDHERNLWIGTSGGGLHRFKRRVFQTVSGPEGLQERVVKSVSSTPSGQVLAGTFGSGVAVVDDFRAKPLVLPEGERMPSFIFSTLADRQGAIWAGGYDAELVRLADGRLRSFPSASVVGESIYALFEDREGRIWIGGSKGAARMEGERLRSWTNEATSTPTAVRHFAEEPASGDVWATTDEAGLWRFRDDRVERVTMNGSTKLRWLSALCFEKNGTLWIGTRGEGLLRWRDGQLKQLAEQDGFPVRVISSLLVDDDGGVWIGSNRGVLRTSWESLNALADRKAERLNGQHFNLSDGMASVECAAGYQPAAMRDTEGRLWFATLKGLAVVNVKALRMNTNAPPVRIEEVTWRERDSAQVCGVQPENVRPSVAHHSPTNAELKLPAGAGRLELHYTALSFTAPEKVRFEYRLEGSGDERWVNAGSRRVAFFPELPAGHYRFQVRACNNDGVWNESGALLSFSVLPFFWQTGWFRALALILVVAGSGGTVWAFTRSKLSRARQENEMTTLQQQLAMVLENTSDLVGFANLQRQPTYLNRAARKAMGLGEKEDLAGYTMRDFYTPAADEKIVREVLPIVREKGIWRGETALRTKDGREIPISQVIMGHRSSNGEWAFLSSIARDISDLKRVEEALRQSEARYRAVVEDQTEFIVRWLPDGTRTFANEAVARFLRKTREELVGASFFPLLPPDDLVRLKENVLSLTPQRPTMTGERRVRGADGSLLWVYWNERALFDEAGKLVEIQSIGFDITERRMAEEALRESEGRLSAMVRHTPNVAMQGYDAEGRVVFWNPASEVVFGWSEHEAVGRDTAGLILDEAGAVEFRQRLKQIGATGNPVGPAEFSFIRKGGQRAVCLSTIFSIPGGSGNLRFVRMDVDITERKAAEQELQQSQRVLATLVSNLPGMVYRSRNDSEWTMLFASEGCKEVTGYDRTELENNRVVSFGSLVHPEDRDWLWKKCQESIANHQPCLNEYRILDKAGRVRWVWERAAGVYDGAGSLVSIEGFIQDITERKRADAISAGQNHVLEMIATGQPLTEILDAITRWIEGLCPGALCSILILDDDGITLRHGSGGSLPAEFCRGIDGGRSCEGAGSCGTAVARKNTVVVTDIATDPLWTNYRDLALSHDLRACWSLPIFSSSRQILGTFANYHREPWAPSELELQATETGGALVAIAIERARFEEQLKKLNAELEQRVLQRTSQLEVLNQELEAFSYSVSHDLRAPLRHLVGFASLLSKQPALTADANARRMTDTISHAALRMGNLIDDLLVFSRMGRTEMRHQPINLNNLVNEARSELQNDVTGRDIVWDVKPLPVVSADRALLRQVFLNLLGNAVKYTRPRAQARIEIWCERQPEEVVFAIRDNGVGFDMAYVERLFGVFQRLHRDEEFEGTGIGLANVRRIISRHGGRTWAEGRLNEGATFYFSLPISAIVDLRP